MQKTISIVILGLAAVAQTTCKQNFRHSHTQTSKFTHSSHAHGTLLDSPAPHFAGADPYKWNVDSHKDMSVTALTMTAPGVSK